MSHPYSNPYTGLNLWEFFYELLSRVWGFLTGQMPFTELVSDEIQMIVL